MSFLSKFSEVAAIRFRRNYLETLSASRVDLRTTVRLSFYLSLAVASSREVMAGALMCVVTLIFTVPFGTHLLPPLLSLAVLSVALIMAVLVSWLLLLPVYFIRIKDWCGDYVLVAASSVLVSTVVAFCLLLSDAMFRTGLDLPFWNTTIRIAVPVFLTFWIGQTFSQFPVAQLLRRREHSRSLMDKLSPKKQGKLISISAQDHYVNITTSSGSELIRMKMSEALENIDPGIGIQIHRSHWVALSAILVVDEQNKRVDLVDGRTLPIAPGRLSEVILELSKRDDLSPNTRLFDDRSARKGLLQRLHHGYEERRKELDLLFLDIYRGSPVDPRLALKIAGLLQKVGLLSSIQLSLLILVMVSPIALGSYGTYDLPIIHALGYWVLIIVVCGPFIQSSHFLVYWLGLRLRWEGRIVSFLLFATESTLAATLMYLVKLIAFPDLASTHYQFLFGVYCSNFVLHAVAHFELSQYRSIAAWEARMSYPPIVLMLPFEARGDLVSLSANGHHVDVVTTSGSASVRLRFKDATSQVGNTPGLQVHRSHWVAARFVQGHLIDQATHYVALTDGSRIPLATTKIDELDSLLEKS